MITLRILCLTLLLVTAIPTQASARLSPQARQTLSRAQLLMDKNSFAPAAALIQRYVNDSDGPHEPEVWLLLGGALFKSGDKVGAGEAYQRGWREHQNNATLCLNAGIVLYEQEQYVEAAGLLERAHDLQEQPSPELLYQSGSAYYMGNRHKDSARVLLRLLNTTKTPRTEWVQLAVHALLESGQTTQTRQLLTRFLNQHPEKADYWQLLAKLQLDEEEYASAGAALEICYRLRPPTTAELERLASLYDYQQAPLLAFASLQRAYGDSPSQEQALKMASLLATAGRINRAVRFLQSHAHTRQSALQQAILLYQDRKFKESEALLAELISHEDLPEAHFYRALCAWELKQWELAHRELDRIADQKRYRGRVSGFLAALDDLKRVQREIPE